MNKAQFDKGLAVRKKVLGDAYVENSIGKATDFTMAFQEFVTENCWGYTWTRDGLDLKTRSILNLGMLCALNRGNELKVHVRGAVNNGVTKEEMTEIFIQVGTYCGMPAALEGFKIAQEVFDDMGV
ncbi:MAG: carboxymuconolactone decarboxylase family protein [Alphaproteobacteria bacterium]